MQSIKVGEILQEGCNDKMQGHKRYVPIEERL